MNNSIYVNSKQKIKTVFCALVAIVLTLCFAFTALGCGDEFETDSEYLMRVAKEECKLKEILWVGIAVKGNTVTGIDYYTPKGSVKRKDPFISSGYAYYVLGINNYGYETLMLVPNKRDSNVKPRAYQWPFSYSFTEIAGFAAEYGYKYADGIDDCLQEYLNGNGALQALDKKYDKYSLKSRCIDVFTELFEDPDKKYDELDVKFVFNFAGGYTDEQWTYYFITQEGGNLLLYEVIETDTETNINIVASYERAKQDAEN